MDADVRRLSVRIVDKLDRFQPDGHDAAADKNQAIDGCSIAGVSGHNRGAWSTSSEHLELS